MREHGVAAQQRVNAEHGCDLYADFTPPDQVGLVAVCDDRPPLPRPMRAIAVECGERADGRCSLRLSLQHQPLLPVFTALCRDIVASTAGGAGTAGLAETVLNRVQRWRALLERDTSGLEEMVLRGLIGELTILESRLLPAMGAREAVQAWRGPFGASQDFLLPQGDRIECKAIDRDADTVSINGLAQLDPGADDLMLAVVRLQTTGTSAEGAVTAGRLIARLMATMASDPEVIDSFQSALAHVGWHEHPSHEELAVRVVAIEAYPVGEGFPRLTRQNVAGGIEEVAYRASLRDQQFSSWAIIA